MRRTAIARQVGLGLGVLSISGVALADHNSLHAEACDEIDTVGGGLLGNSPGGGTLGWDVGSGQCNGSFVVTRDADGALELGLRVEQRRVGQVERQEDNVYAIETGNDDNAPAALNRAWWNFQGSIAFNGDISSMKELTLEIETIAGPNQPALSSFDLLAARPLIDDRIGGGTAEYSDIYQFSQNPEFGWFATASDTDANPTGAFDYDAEGIWEFTLTAKPATGPSSSVTMCVRTRGAGPLDNSRNPCDGRRSKRSKKSKRSN